MIVFLAAVAWSIFILVICLLPGNDLPEQPFFNSDKLIHFLVFALHAALWYGVLAKRKRPVIRIYSIAVLSSVSFGIAIELVQGNFIKGRSCDVADMIANSIGALAGAGIAVWLVQLKRKKAA